LKGAVKWLRGLVVGLSPRRLGFDSTVIYMRIMVENVGLGQFFPFQYFIAIAPQFNFMLFLPEGQRSEAWEPSKKQFREFWIEKNFLLVIKGSSVSCDAVRHGMGLPCARPDMLAMSAAL